MKTSRVLLFLAVLAAAFFMIGRATVNRTGEGADAPNRGPAVTRTPSAETSAPARIPGPYGHILRYFATVHEENLPRQGVLGGTMVAGTVAFPKDFSRRAGQRFYVVGSDGHLLETWSYELRNNGSWKHIDTHDGYAPVDFQDHPGAYDVYLWRPGFYIPAEDDS